MTVISSDFNATTVQLSLSLAPTEATIYTIFASAQTAPMTFPVAMQFGGTMGSDYGAPRIALPAVAQDSWLSVGATATSDVLGSVGIDYTSWATAGISTTDGAVFWIDQNNAGVEKNLI